MPDRDTTCDNFRAACFVGMFLLPWVVELAPFLFF